MDKTAALCLGLDLGTTNVKALITDTRGVVQSEFARSVTLTAVGGGGVEQDIEEIWRAAIEALRGALRAVNPTAVEAIGVSSQGGALQLLAAGGRPLGQVVSWLDHRGLHDDEVLTAALGRPWFRQRIGHGRCAYAAGQLLRLRREAPAWLAPPNRIGFVGDIIVGRLSGRAAHDATSAGLTLLLNPQRGGYDPDLLQRLEISNGQLPDLISAREPAGRLRGEIADATGMRRGIPVSAAVHDQYAAALGTGAVKPGVIMVGAGTAWVLLAVSPHLPALVTDDAFVCTHVINGLFGEILSLVNGGSVVSWALRLIGREPASAAEIESLLAAAPAGCDGLSCWPFVTPFGASGLAPGTRGRLGGIQLGHTSAHLVRAVVEGLTFELNRHLAFLKQAGLPVDRLVLGGVVAGSRATTQMIADVTGLPLDCSASGGGSVLGAAILARGLLEPDRSLAELSEEMRPVARRVEPGKNAATYRELFDRYVQSLPRQMAQETEAESSGYARKSVVDSSASGPAVLSRTQAESKALGHDVNTETNSPNR
jgi:xylulokinase